MIRSAFGIFICAFTASSAFATPSIAPSVPWSGCAQMAISKTRTAIYPPEDLKTLYCWLGLGNLDAGVEIARDFQRQSPPDFKKARKLLLDLAKGTQQDGSSIESKGSVSGGGYSTAHINEDGSIGEIAYRPPSIVAQRELAKMYLLGQGTKANVGTAVGWLKKAEKGGDVEAGVLHKALVAKGYSKD